MGLLRESSDCASASEIFGADASFARSYAGAPCLPSVSLRSRPGGRSLVTYGFGGGGLLLVDDDLLPHAAASITRQIAFFTRAPYSTTTRSLAPRPNVSGMY